MVLSTVRESGYSVPLAMAEEDMETTSESEFDDAPPVHPVPTMQGAFEESMAETMNADDQDEASEHFSKADSVARRKALLEQEQYERTVAGRWKQKAGERFHPLWKLVAQISFGMHLLQQGLAKSDEEVLKILQTHVDEVDGFLERTTEDFDLGQSDINERIRYLKLPLEHGEVFDQMLLDRAFRTAIVEGNEKIEHIIDRTAAAMNDALKDVQKGLDATRELAKYMTRVDKMWEDRTEEHDSVYLAMIGNTEGWTRAFLTLQSKGGHLRKALVHLGGIVAEMQKRAGAASRKNLVPSRSTTGRYAVSTQPESARNTPTPPRSPLKPLPTAPSSASRASPSHNRKGSNPRSASESPNTNQSSVNNTQRSSRKGSLTSPRITDFASTPQQPAWISSSPDPSRNGRTPTPDRSSRAHEYARSSKNPQGLGITDSKGQVRSTAHAGQEQSRKIKSPEPGKSKDGSTPWYKGVLGRDTHRSSKDAELRSPALRSTQPDVSMKRPRNERPFNNTDNRFRDVRSPEPIAEETSSINSSSLMPAQIMANMADASKSSTSESSSRRISLTDRTRSILGRKPSIQKDGNSQAESKRSNIDFDGDSHTSKLHQGIQRDRQSEELANSKVLRRLSSRRKRDSVGQTTNLSSPTSANNTQIEPSLQSENNDIPERDAFAPLTLLPAQPNFSPLQDAFSATDLARRSRPVSRSDKKIGIPSSSTTNPQNASETRQQLVESRGGTHPLLQEEHHARYNARTPGNNSPKDLPLRHYHSSTEFAQSNPDLSQTRIEGDKTPRRSSSFIYPPKSPIPEVPFTESSARSPSNPADQITPQASSLNLLRQNTSRASDIVLGVHPAHRQRERDSVSTRTPSPIASTTSSIPEQGATPPPISTGPSHPNSPPARFGQSPTPRVQSPPPQANITSDSSTSNSTQQHGDPAQMPFYLNPASSTALVDFLASSPPPSPPHAPHRDDVETPQPAASTTDVTYHTIIDRNHTASPPPPPPGRSRFGLLSASTTDLRNGALNGFRGGDRKKSLGWKKMFSGQPKPPKERKERSGKKFIQWGRDPPADGGRGHEYGNDNMLDREKERDGGFMGVGKDGVWISKKNFVRT